MKISVFGIGYVGAVASACLAETGHEVVAVDPFEVKVNCINEGRSPIVERGLDELIARNVKKQRLRATTDGRAAMLETEMSLVCVGTPSAENGALDYSYIRSTCRQIGVVLREKNDFHIVVIRSTVVPGTLMNVIKPILEEESGKRAGVDFGLGNNPEFLRESTAVEDYFNPTQIVVGALDPRTAEAIMSLYEGLAAPRTITDVNVAEGVKYVSNAWRASKISFANEIGNILKSHGVDSHKVMNVFFQDRKINMSSSFLMPGFAFGGSCLPKDIRALTASANDRGVPTPVFDSLLAANRMQIERGLDLVRKAPGRRVALLGLSFKPGTDDLRESPLVTLAEALLKEGYDLRIYDPAVNAARRMKGSSHDYIEEKMAHLSQRLVDTPAEILSGSDIFVIGNGTPEFADILEKTDENACIIDLVRLHEPLESRKSYAGICW